MIQINAQNIAATASLLTEFEAKLKTLASLVPTVTSSKLVDLQHDKLNNKTIDTLLKLSLDVAEKIGLNGTKRLVNLIQGDLDKVTVGNLGNDLRRLQRMLEDELNDEWIMHIPKDNALWFNNGKSFGDKVSDAFPSALNDILEAGNCYALDRPTACVFHAMRILEYGLGALAKDVSQVFDVQQWHTIIEKIEAEIKKLRNLPQGTQKSERLQFLSEAAKEFMYFKEGWRNHVFHKQVIYDMSQAYSVLSHVRTFMQHISIRLREIP